MLFSHKNIYQFYFDYSAKEKNSEEARNMYLYFVFVENMYDRMNWLILRTFNESLPKYAMHSAAHESTCVGELGHHGIIHDSKVHGANMGPIWGRQDPDGPHVGPMNFAIWDVMVCNLFWPKPLPEPMMT